MVMYIAQAIGWGWSWLLRRPRNQAIPHRDLEHAHWDPIARRWLRHSEIQERTPARAA
jgi:hypothetical protein